MPSTERNRGGTGPLVPRVTKGLPVGQQRDASAPSQAPQEPAQTIQAPQAAASALLSAPETPETPETTTAPSAAPQEPAQAPQGALKLPSAPQVAPVPSVQADCSVQELIDPSVASMLPPVTTRPVAEVSALTALLQAMGQGGEPLGPLVLLSRGEEGEDDTPAKKKTKAKGGTTGTATLLEADADPSARKWPSGPLVGRDLFTPDEVQQLVEAVLMDEDILEHPTMPGLTRARLREVARAAGFEPNRFGRFSAAILVWFARAGVTVLEDDKAKSEWARPRPIASRDRAVIRGMLRAVDPPDGDAVAIARAAGLDSTAP